MINKSKRKSKLKSSKEKSKRKRGIDEDLESGFTDADLLEE